MLLGFLAILAFSLIVVGGALQLSAAPDPHPEPLINRDLMEFRGETIVSLAELTALRAENAALKAEVASLRATVQKLIEQQQRGANLRVPPTTP